MYEKEIAGRSIREWTREFPVLEDVIASEEVFWRNPNYDRFQISEERLPFSANGLKDAEDRLSRFSSYIVREFPETKERNGLIESPLHRVPAIKRRMEEFYGVKLRGEFLVKRDDILPVSGSIKARGGIYEVLKHAEDLAVENGLISVTDDYAAFASPRFREFFSGYSLAVGSTGNLGLSIGIMGARLGFKVTVHMSSDAKAWKKRLLRDIGVNVVEYESDYSAAVASGRKLAQEDPEMHFIDDENSVDLFLGYAVAAVRLQGQLRDLPIEASQKRPLFVYLPCGVGGGPGGICFGLKTIFGDNVHCFFAEPTRSPCMLLGLLTGLHDKVCVADFGLDNATEADGLAVGRPSGFVGKNMGRRISGVYTASDDSLHVCLGALAETEDIFIEPSAAAGITGPFRLFASPGGRQFLETAGIGPEQMENAVHIAWSTGGGMVPKEIMGGYLAKAASLFSP